MMGYSRIPAVWLDALKPIEDIPFSYTDLSLNKVYETGYRQALEMVRRQGGKVDGETITLPDQPARPVRLEVNFPGMEPSGRKYIGTRVESQGEVTLEGTGFVLIGEPIVTGREYGRDFVFRVEMTIDNGQPETFGMPADDRIRRQEVAWKYNLAPGNHTVRLKVLNPVPGGSIQIRDLITYRKI
jgi:hypothetical protein